MFTIDLTIDLLSDKSTSVLNLDLGQVNIVHVTSGVIWSQLGQVWHRMGQFWDCLKSSFRKLLNNHRGHNLTTIARGISGLTPKWVRKWLQNGTNPVSQNILIFDLEKIPDLYYLGANLTDF